MTAKKKATEAVSTPCSSCPWRQANQGKPHPHGFYTFLNLRRLWNQIRKGGRPQSCHPTDPGHPDHGAKPDSVPRECAGAVIVVLRELQSMADSNSEGIIGPEEVDAYFERRRKHGLTKAGIMYWLVSRYTLGDKPYFGEGVLPEVNRDEPGIGLPAKLAEG